MGFDATSSLSGCEERGGGRGGKKGGERKRGAKVEKVKPLPASTGGGGGGKKKGNNADFH